MDDSKLEEAREKGKQAFLAGHGRNPWDDYNQADLAGYEVGESPVWDYLREWYRGWDQANLDAPAPGEVSKLTAGQVIKEDMVGREAEIYFPEDGSFRPAFIEAVGTPLVKVVMRETLEVAFVLHAQIKPLDLGLGDLDGVYEVVGGCNGLYVYHLATDHCAGAGDGSEMTMADLCEFARTDPVGFAEAYGPPPTPRICMSIGCDNAVEKVTELRDVGGTMRSLPICEECKAKIVEGITSKMRESLARKREERAAKNK